MCVVFIHIHFQMVAAICFDILCDKTFDLFMTYLLPYLLAVGVVSAISFCLTYLLTALLTYLVTLFLTCLLTIFLVLWQAQYLVKLEGYAFGSTQCK